MQSRDRASYRHHLLVWIEGELVELLRDGIQRRLLPSGPPVGDTQCSFQREAQPLPPLLERLSLLLESLPYESQAFTSQLHLALVPVACSHRSAAVSSQVCEGLQCRPTQVLHGLVAAERKRVAQALLLASAEPGPWRGPG